MNNLKQAIREFQASLKKGSRASRIVDDAIDESIHRNRRPRLDFDSAVFRELKSRAEDWSKDGHGFDFWGEEDGEEWRIFLEGDRPEPDFDD